MNKRTLATLGLAAWVALTPLASSTQKGSIKEDVSTNLTEAIDTSKDQKKDSINFLDAQRDLELRKDIQELLENELANNKEIKQLKEKYGEEFILHHMPSIVSLIVRHADDYWTFNQNGDYVLNEKRVKELLEYMFLDQDKEELGKWVLAFGALSSVLAFIVIKLINKNNRKRETRLEKKENKKNKKKT